MSENTDNREYRRDSAYLPPPGGPSPPKPIADAAEAMRLAGLDVEDAASRLASAAATAKAAPGADRAAASSARQRGEDPPPATAPAAELEHQAARRALDDARDVHHRSHRHFEWALREHGPEYAESLRDQIEREHREAEALRDQYVEKVRAMENYRFTAIQARRYQTGPVGDYARMLRLNERALDARIARAIDPLREHLSQLVPPSQADIDAEQAKWEGRVEENAEMARFARGGVYVSSEDQW